MHCYDKRSRSTKVFQIVPNNQLQETSPSPVQLQRCDTTETKNEDLNNDNDALEQQSLTIMTTYKSDFNSDTSNDTTRSSSATTASSTDGEVCIVHIVHIVYSSIIGCTCTPKVTKQLSKAKKISYNQR